MSASNFYSNTNLSTLYTTSNNSYDCSPSQLYAFEQTNKMNDPIDDIKILKEEIQYQDDEPTDLLDFDVKANSDSFNSNPLTKNLTIDTNFEYQMPYNNEYEQNDFRYQQQQQQFPEQQQDQNYYGIAQSSSSSNRTQPSAGTSVYFKQENLLQQTPPVFRPPPATYYSNFYPRHNIPYNLNYHHLLPNNLNTMQSWYNNSTNQYYRNLPSTSTGGNGSGGSASYYDGNNGGSGSNIDHQSIMNMTHYSNNSSGREARNRAEKQRRDKLNGSIQDLATMVPHVAESPRRVDKTAVLRYSAHGLRIRYVFGKSLENVENHSITGLALTDTLMKLLDGFLLTITCRGQIVLISPSVEQHLGHCQSDLFGQNILHITHPDDHQMLKQQLIPKDLDTLFDIQPEDKNGQPRPRSQEEEDEIDQKLRQDRRCFTLRLARATPRSEPTQYEIVRIEGNFRRADSAPRGVKASTSPPGLQIIRRARGRDESSLPLQSISGNDIILICVARIIKPPKIMDKLLESNQYEYKTRHLIDGRIIQCDQRISIVAGYMTDEVNGLCPFTFMHQDDVRWVIVALRQMYDSKSSYGESCYRLLTRPGRFVYLRTRGYLDIDKTTNKVHSFVCINTLISEEEGKKRCEEMKKKFSVIINTKVPDSTIDAPASDNAQQLEKAVMYLIQNLHHDNPASQCDEYDDTDDDAVSACGSVSETATVTEITDNQYKRKVPAIDLVPPQPASIRSSISKSVNVVNVTSAKCFRLNKAMNSPISEDPLGSPKNSPQSYYSPKHSPQSYFSPKHSPQANYSPPQTISSPKEKFSSPPPPTLVNQNRPSVLYKGASSSALGNASQSNNSIIMDKSDINSDDSNSSLATANYEISDKIILTKTILNTKASNSINNFQDQGNSSVNTAKQMYSTNNNNNNNSNNSNNNINKNFDKLSKSGAATPTTTYITCQPTSVLKRTHSDEDPCILTKRRNLIPINNSIICDITKNNNNSRTEITIINSSIKNSHSELSSALTNSFVQIDRSLSSIKSAATELRDQCNIYPITSSQNQLNEIIEEQHEQKELLANIQNEYQAHLESQSSFELNESNDDDEIELTHNSKQTEHKSR